MAVIAGPAAVLAAEPPIAVDGTESTMMNTPVLIALDAFDPDFDSLVYSIVSGPAHGTINAADSDCQDGFCTYTPATDFVGSDSFTWKANDGTSDSNVATVTIAVTAPICAVSPGVCIDNGTILLGINPEGHLNVDGDIPSSGGTLPVGLRYLPTGAEATAPGCLCEGWGAADATSGTTGYANVAIDGVQNLQPESFTTTATTAVSVVRIADQGDDVLRVTHDYHPSPATPNLYEVTVTIENLSASTIDARYRRVMDWDIEPTAFSEFVTIVTGGSTALLFASDNGFASANPLAGPSQLNFNGEAVDDGPADHGALFDFGFGAVAPGGSVTFRTFYGAAATEAEALTALTRVHAEVWSLGQPNTPDGPTLGTPNTFIFAFAGVGGQPVNTPPDAVDDSATTAANTPVTVNVLANDTDADGDALSVTSATDPPNGTVTINVDGTITYAPDAGFSGTDTFHYTISDGHGGTDTAQVTITVTGGAPNVPPTVNAGGPYTGAEGSAIPVDGTVADSDGPTLTTAWTYAAGAGVDAGASCSFGDASAVDTTVTCTDDGTYTLTLTANDGVNSPVLDTATLTVSNANPSVSITSPADASVFGVGGTVNVNAAFSDAGSNDTHTCSIDWGDGSTTAGVITSGTCTGSHAYAAVGVYTVTVTVTDDDSGEGSDEIMVVVSDQTTKVTGGGWMAVGTGRTSFGFVAKEDTEGLHGQIQVRAPGNQRFHGNVVLTLVSTGNSAAWSGTGRWNGVDGYAFEVSVVDNRKGGGKKGSADTISLTIRDGSGAIVFSASGSLKGGDITVH